MFRDFQSCVYDYSCLYGNAGQQPQWCFSSTSPWNTYDTFITSHMYAWYDDFLVDYSISAFHFLHLYDDFIVQRIRSRAQRRNETILSELII